MKQMEINLPWQSALDEEKLRLMALAPEELFAMEFCTPYEIPMGDWSIDYVLWHHVRSEDIESKTEENPFQSQINQSFSIRGPQREIHSFVLQAHRKLFMCGYKNYLAGFALDETGRILPIEDDIFYAHD